VIGLGVAVLVGLLALAGSGGLSGDPTADAAGGSSKRDRMREEVDDEAGAPRNGRDPASQAQASLASAAASPQGNGRRVERPAAAVHGDHGRDVVPSDVLGEGRRRGLTAAGCFADYGVPGQQCLPAHAATRGVVTCAGVLAHFPNGVQVSGRDRFRLDRNRDGTACGTGDL
jgi:hypothetical protein